MHQHAHSRPLTTSRSGGLVAALAVVGVGSPPARAGSQARAKPCVLALNRRRWSGADLTPLIVDFHLDCARRCGAWWRDAD